MSLPPVVTHSGKQGDACASIPIMRIIRDIYGRALDVVLTQYSHAIAPLILDETGLVASLTIFDQYKPQAREPGMQPTDFPLPKHLLEHGHRDVFRLGFHRHPLGNEDLTSCQADKYNLKPLCKGGPWLPLVKVDPKGPIVAHAPVEDQRYLTVLARLLARNKGKQIRLIGTSVECAIYQSVGLHRVEGITLHDFSDFGKVRTLGEGASMFVGVASGPAVVLAAAGLPSKWFLQAGARRQCIPNGLDVKELKTI